MIDWEVSVSHVFREANMSADLLAGQGAMGSESLVCWGNEVCSTGRCIVGISFVLYFLY